MVKPHLPRIWAVIVEQPDATGRDFGVPSIADFLPEKQGLMG
jgi:hypothetical protein